MIYNTLQEVLLIYIDILQDLSYNHRCDYIINYDYICIDL